MILLAYYSQNSLQMFKAYNEYYSCNNHGITIPVSPVTAVENIMPSKDEQSNRMHSGPVEHNENNNDNDEDYADYDASDGGNKDVNQANKGVGEGNEADDQDKIDDGEDTCDEKENDDEDYDSNEGDNDDGGKFLHRLLKVEVEEDSNQSEESNSLGGSIASNDPEFADGQFKIHFAKQNTYDMYARETASGMVGGRKTYKKWRLVLAFARQTATAADASSASTGIRMCGAA